MFKKLLAVALAILATLMIVSCQQPNNSDPLDKLNYHDMPVTKKNLQNDNGHIVLRGREGITLDPLDALHRWPTLSHYDSTSKTVTILINRENIGYCYEIYNADSDGKILRTEKGLLSAPFYAYALCYADDGIEGVPYSWCAAAPDGTVYEGKIREILFAINILKDNYMPERDVALTGFLAGYQLPGDKYEFFTNIYRYFSNTGSVDFLTNQCKKGVDTFAPPEGFVSKISTIAALKWNMYTGQVPSANNISNMAKRMDGIRPVFEEE